MLFVLHLIAFAATVCATPHFDADRYEVSVSDCLAPQPDLTLVRLLDADETIRVKLPPSQFLDAVSLADQRYYASNRTRLIRPAYDDACLLDRARGHWCTPILAMDGPTIIATAQFCLTVQCNATQHGPLHWPADELRFDITDCRRGAYFGAVKAAGGSGAYLYSVKPLFGSFRADCRNSSAHLRIDKYLKRLNGTVRFQLAVEDLARKGKVWVPALARLHCNVTTRPPRFTSDQFGVELHHCLPNRTRAIGRATVVGGEKPVLISGHGNNNYRVTANGDLFHVQYLYPFTSRLTRPHESVDLHAIDALGRTATALSHFRIAETCDGDPPVHMNQSDYEFAFTACSSQADDCTVGRVKAVGHRSSYRYEFVGTQNLCDMIEVKQDGRVTFGPATCIAHSQCCPRAQLYGGNVAALDLRTGRPTSERAQLRLINGCSY